MVPGVIELVYRSRLALKSRDAKSDDISKTGHLGAIVRVGFERLAQTREKNPRGRDGLDRGSLCGHQLVTVNVNTTAVSEPNSTVLFSRHRTAVLLHHFP